MFKKTSYIALLLLLAGCERPTDLSQREQVTQLVEHGWLPEFFRQKTIVEGREIHDIDTNTLWGYVIFPNHFALEQHCLQVKQPIPYYQPPWAMRDTWISKEKYQKQTQYLCSQISPDLNFFRIENKLFFIRN